MIPFCDIVYSSEYLKLRQTFVAEALGSEFALSTLVWRAYNAGRLSPDRLDPDDAYVRKERHRERQLRHQEHLKRMATK
jgi:hypothetical protein